MAFIGLGSAGRAFQCDRYGIVSKSLVAQCETINYGGCKQRKDCSLFEEKHGLWLQGPFVVGVTCSSGDIAESIFMWIGEEFLNLTRDNYLDMPKAGDPQYKMTTLGYEEGWIPWQEVWRGGVSFHNTARPTPPTPAPTPCTNAMHHA